MKSLPQHGGAKLQRRKISAKQRGVVLFFALIALLILSLAAVALIRSVDTSTLIAGNLAFKQAATASGDAGVEAAITQLTTIQAANTGLNVIDNANHPFNITNLAVRPGYFSYADPALNLTADATWNDTNSVLVGTDGGDNTTRYIIQRMCRDPGQLATSTNCMFSSAIEDTGGQGIPLPQEICSGLGCPQSGQTPLARVTIRARGPKDTVSYVQAFVY